MRSILLFLYVICATWSLPSQAQGNASATDKPTREELLKAALARERGGITAMEAFPSGREGVVIGHASGVVMHCHGEDTCAEFSGTPQVAVAHIAISRRGASDIIWVAYPGGSLYQCIDSVCNRFDWGAPD